MADLLKGLNEAQRQAVVHGEGPLLVLAGPGSGKTRVITHRIAHLIEAHGVLARQILAVTFTNKAAGEMRRRVAELVHGEAPWVSTFHSFCARLLRQYAPEVGLTPHFTILDQDDRPKLVARIMREMEIDVVHYPPNGVDRRISQLKNELTSPEEFSQKASDLFDRLVADVYPRYQTRLKEQNSVDFDELLMLVANLLRTNPQVRERLDERFRFVLVDEYQDTNLAQYAIARGLSISHPNLCVTGDPDQSIYSWRGANLSNILHFEEDFPGAVVARLEQNYRSTGHILAVADHLIRHNLRRKQKELVTDNPLGSKVTVYCHTDDASEANSAAETIRQAIDTARRRYRDFAVFVRMNSLTRPVEAAFRARGIPYQVIGGYSFFERKEIRDILAYARLLINPRDDAAFARIVNTPTRGIGASTLERLGNFARVRGLSMVEALGEADIVPGVKGKQALALRDFSMLLREMAPVAAMSPAEAIEAIIDQTEYRKSLEDGDEEEQQERLANLADMVTGADNFSREYPEADLAEFLESVSLVSDSDLRDEESDLVTIMTLHAAKGLEFPVVFLIAFEHDILPHERSVNEGNEEEERRLAFVGITRAREELFISYVRRRTFQGRTVYPAASPFLAELPNESLERQDIIAGPSRQEEDYHESQETGYEEPEIQVSHRSSEPSTADRFHKGMMVEHPRYGQGMILQLDGMGDDRKATIQFPTVGAKRFVLSKAPLEPVVGS